MPAQPKMRKLIIRTAPKAAAIDRMWITCKVGIAQKWVTNHMLSDVSEIHSEKSTRNVVLSHSVKLNNRSLIGNVFPLPLPLGTRAASGGLLPACRVNYGNRQLHTLRLAAFGTPLEISISQSAGLPRGNTFLTLSTRTIPVFAAKGPRSGKSADSRNVDFAPSRPKLSLTQTFCRASFFEQQGIVKGPNSH